MSDMKPRLVGGFGEINFGKQYRQGNRIYDADAIAVCLTAQPFIYMGSDDIKSIFPKCLIERRPFSIKRTPYSITFRYIFYDWFNRIIWCI